MLEHVYLMSGLNLTVKPFVNVFSKVFTSCCCYEYYYCYCYYCYVVNQRNLLLSSLLYVTCTKKCKED